jgi:hypothetical protein
VSTSELEGHPQEGRAVAAWPARALQAAPPVPLRAALAGPIVAGVAVALALLATRLADVPLRDPGGVTIRRLVTATLILLGLAALDLLVRAVRREGGVPGWAAISGAARARWSWGRVAAVVGALLAFHVTYFAYRNIKSVAPLLRPGDVFDQQLLDFDRWLFGGHDPAALLHDLLGTASAAHGLADVYMIFFTVIPVALAVGLVLVPDLRAGLFVATALSLTWLLGAGSYLVLPSIGPFHFDAATFADIPATAVRELQDSLMSRRAAFLADPSAPGAAQSIGAFASLHTAIWCTILLLAHVLRAPRMLLAIIWALAVLTIVATIYFGWHYLLDDVAGVAIAVLAVGIAAALTGLVRRPAREAT